MKKGMLVGMLRATTDSSNKGVSSQYDNMIIIGEGVTGIFEVEENEPYLELIQDKVMGRERVYAEVHYPENHANTDEHHMFGGNFCFTSDSRWKFGAVKIHDRVE